MLPECISEWQIFAHVGDAIGLCNLRLKFTVTTGWTGTSRVHGLEVRPKNGERWTRGRVQFGFCVYFVHGRRSFPAEYRRERGVRKRSCNTKRSFVHPVPLIATHETVFFFNLIEKTNRLFQTKISTVSFYFDLLHLSDKTCFISVILRIIIT